MSSQHKRIFLYILTLAFGLFSPFANSSVDGVFNGTVTTDLSCFAPIMVPGGFPEPTNISISLSTGPSGGVVNSVSMSSPHFIFTSSSAGNYTDSPPNPDGSINLTGSINGNMTVTFGDSNVDGNYSGAIFSFEAIFNTDNTLDLVGSTDIMFNGGSPCSDGDVAFSLPATLTGSGGVQVDPEITPGTTITTPLILKTEIQVIVSDLQFRINDVLRAWQLRRKQFSSPRDRRRDREREDQDSSLSPTGDASEVVADRREQEDNQPSVVIRPTASGFMMNRLSGMNAGDGTYLYGAWGSYSYTDFENDFASTAFDGRRHGGLVGLDVSPWEGLLLGVAVGYEDSDIDTDFNLGNQETDGFTVAPYLGALINDTWSVSAGFGYSSLDTDQFRILPGTTTRVTSSPDSDRWFAMFNLNGLTTYDNWIIGGQIGVLYARNEQDAYVETNTATGVTTAVAAMDTKLAQFNIGADVAYSYGEFEPFARVMYENDISQTEIGVIGGPQPAFDDDDVLLGFGMRYFGANSLTGNLEFSTRLGREDYDEYDISATIRYDW